MRPIDADALKETICNNVYPVADSFNSRDYGMFWTGGIEKAIDEQPTIGKWIPCSERLPEMCENVLLYIPPREGVRQHGIRIGYCDEDNPIPEDEDGEHNFWGMKTYGGKWHVTGWGYYDEPIPIAWMPLPAPYGGESNG